MQNDKSNNEISIPLEILNTLIPIWGKALIGKSNYLVNQYKNIQLVDKENWTTLDADQLFELCLSWKQRFLCERSDTNVGSLEWLMCILRHNATTYDLVLEQSAEQHSWALGFGSLLRLQADCLIISFLQKNNLYDQLIKKCQVEWMWRND